MIGQPPSGRGWALAAGLSVMVHAAVAGAVLWQPAWPWQSVTTPSGPAPLEVTALALPQPSLQQAIQPEPAQPETARPDTPPLDAALPETALPETAPHGDAARPPQAEIAALAPPETAAPERPASPLLQNSALPTAPGPAASPAPRSMGQPGAQVTPEPAPNSARIAQDDPRLLALFDAIRTRLRAPCLLALPVLDDRGGIGLNLLAADDAQIPGLLRDLTQGQDSPIEGRAQLLDARQCPALAYARRDPRYPVLPLSISLDRSDIASGDLLSGTIAGGAGRHVSLVLIDDNGVTHDMRRFLVNAGGHIRFDLPIARDGAARDTHQLILAVASDSRPQTISDAAGDTAEVFFDRLARETGPEAMIGVAGFYLR